MEKDETGARPGAARKEVAREAEERMEDWYREGATTEVEEGEVVRGRVVHIGTSEVLVDVGYKSEGAIPIDEFHRAARCLGSATRSRSISRPRKTPRA